MKKRAASPLFYGVLIAVSLGVPWLVVPHVQGLITTTTWGAGLTALFAALYIGELKQESIGQLYQALAAANLRSAEHAIFSQQALKKIRNIRQLFLLSNVVKLVGALTAIYLLNEKPTTIPTIVGALRIALSMFLLSMVLFARLWTEVSLTEQILMAAKQSALVQARRDAFLLAGRAAKSYDFSSDEAAKSFEKEPTAPFAA